MKSTGLNIFSENCLPLQKIGRTALTIGNFDGCHLGHQQLIQRTLDLAAQVHAEPTSLTFSPRPEHYFKPRALENDNLFTPAMKTRAFRELGIKFHCVQDFDSAISQMEATEFYQSVVVDQLRAAAVVVGENFRFGRGRTGNSSTLRQCGIEHGIEIAIVPSATYESEIVSSTRIRQAIAAGNPESAARLLGRPYLLEGTLSKGDQLGRTIGFPTLNLSCPDQMIPLKGVYCGWVWLEKICQENCPKVTALPHDVLPAAINIGQRPTVNGTELRIEAHVLSEIRIQDSYDINAGFYFTHRIRGEQKFSGLDALRKQISIDTSQARELLGIK